MEALGRLYYLFALRPYAGRLARTLRREAKAYLFDFSEVADPGARFENLAALHLLTESGRPYLLLETKLSARDISPSLLYFRDRLKPAHAVQLSREEPRGGPRVVQGVLRMGAAGFLSGM